MASFLIFRSEKENLSFVQIVFFGFGAIIVWSLTALLHHIYLEKIGLNLLIAWEPFSLLDLQQLLTTSEHYDGGTKKVGPVFFDLRNVNVENIKMPDIRRQLIRKSYLGPDLSSFPCVYWVDGEEAFSIVSESFTYARQIQRTASSTMFVTKELTEAASWLSKFLGKDKFEIYRQINATYEPIERPSPTGEL